MILCDDPKDEIVEEVLDWKYRHLDMSKEQISRELGIPLSVIREICKTVEYALVPKVKCPSCGNKVIYQCIACRDEKNETIRNQVRHLIGA